MMTLDPPLTSRRDPIAHAIEWHLRKVGMEFQCEVKAGKSSPKIYLQASGISVNADSLDTAFMRLALTITENGYADDSLKTALRGLLNASDF